MAAAPDRRPDAMLLRSLFEEDSRRLHDGTGGRSSGVAGSGSEDQCGSGLHNGYRNHEYHHFSLDARANYVGPSQWFSSASHRLD